MIWFETTSSFHNHACYLIHTANDPEEASIDINITQEQGRVLVTVLHVVGNIDSATYQDFQSKVEELIFGGARHLLVDLEKVPLVSSAGLRALNNIFNRLRRLSPNVSDEEMRIWINAGTYKSPYLKLLNPSQASIVALENSGFSLFMQIFNDINAAIASY